jgi:L-fuculose-phosphate aldolase
MAELKALAAALLDTARGMGVAGINRGSAGNVSVRVPGPGFAFLITPTGMAYADCVAEDMVKVGAGGTACPAWGTAVGHRAPSSEWRFHHDLYQARPEFGAIVHAHAPFATALACHHRDIPPFHYMIARFGGSDVRCASYATFGTQALSDAVLRAMVGRSACLMAHHGLLVAGATLNQALDRAVELETLCEQYWRALQLGEPPLLDDDEMARVLTRFADYGSQPDA